MKTNLRFFYVSFLFIFLVSCNTENINIEEAYNSITVEELTYYVENLGSDAFQGRKPCTEGELKTLAFLEKEMKKTGLKPVFNGSFLQEVPMVEIASNLPDNPVIKLKSTKMTLAFPDDIAIESQRITESVRIENSELVFAGFGIVAPEYGWNDYEDLNVKGKTVIVLVNDPGLYTGDKDFFKGETMTYYGRWTYKYEEAARQGAEGVLIIHETRGAGYPYTIPRKSALGSSFYLDDVNNYSDKCAFQGWLSARTAELLMNKRGYEVENLRKEACKKDFTGFSLDASLSLSISNSITRNISHNIAGIIEGTKYPDECIVYSAHWDHFGIGEPENGDSIYNGAVDNGTSLAWMMEIADAFLTLPEPPERSVIFLAPTAEEQGLLGSAWYADHPVIPMEKTLASINNDLLLPIGRMRDVMVTGFGQSSLDSLVEIAAGKQDRYLFPDPNPHTGMYFRSDHFSFAKKGVPSLFVRGNCDSRDHGREWAAGQERDYIENKYHRPADNYYPEIWDFRGIVEDAQLAFEVGFMLTETEKFPEWSDGSEFKAIRMGSVK